MLLNSNAWLQEERGSTDRGIATTDFRERRGSTGAGEVKTAYRKEGKYWRW
jgi:hypothetical protein